MNKIVEIKDLHFRYNQDPVLKGVNLEINKGELVILLGENGSGKSTLLKLILGELEPVKGSVSLLGKNPRTKMSFKDVGYVPQMRVVDQMAFPVTCKELVVQNLYKDFGFIKIPRKANYQKAEKILEEMGLKDYIDTPITELSGGLKQRAMISRSLINEPNLLILDEPTAGVDKFSKDHLAELLMDLSSKRNLTLILVTHEVDFLEDIVEKFKIYKLEEGRIKDVSI